MVFILNFTRQADTAATKEPDHGRHLKIPRRRVENLTCRRGEAERGRLTDYIHDSRLARRLTCA
jgi:hypothetical protein